MSIPDMKYGIPYKENMLITDHPNMGLTTLASAGGQTTCRNYSNNKN